MSMTVELDKAKHELVIRIPANENGGLSKSGKSKIVASTHGNIATACVVQGKPLVVSVNAYVKA